MAKKPSLTEILSGYVSGTSINTALQALRNAFDNTLSLDGSTPNAMNADLDMNSNDVNNARYVNADRLYLGGTRVTSASSTPTWQGAWSTATAYSVDDLVSNDGSTYICTEDHTAGTFSTDLAAFKWELVASKGAAGAGTGDLLAANNLSDLADADTALANLGGGTAGITIFKDVTEAAIRAQLDLEVGTDVQAQNDLLQDIAGLSLTAGDILYYDGADIVNLGIGTAGQVLTTNSGATAPEWATASSLGVGQTWQDLTASRSANTSYQNTSGKPIQVSIYARNSAANITFAFQASTNGSTWVDVANGTTNNADAANVSIQAIVPDDHYYRFTSTSSYTELNWSELR